jgi:hypothetical protein
MCPFGELSTGADTGKKTPGTRLTAGGTGKVSLLSIEPALSALSVSIYPMNSPAKAIALGFLLHATLHTAGAVVFYTPVSITSSNSVAFFAITQLYQGPGVGYSATAPHDGVIGQNWVTDAPGGFPSDYLLHDPAPSSSSTSERTGC